MGPAPAPENPGSSKQNFPSCPPSPLGGRRPLPPEQEPEDKDDMVRLQISGNYDTIRSIRSMASIQTLEENADAPHTPQHRHSHDTISWLDFESKKSNHSHLGEKLGHSMHQSCERFSWKDSAMSFFPLFERMKKLNYSVKDDLVTDIIAGLTIAILHIPQGIAYSFLIGISPVYGLYTSFFPVLIYAFMGSAQHISIGTIAVVDIMLAEIVKKYTDNYEAYAATQVLASSLLNDTTTTFASIASSTGTMSSVLSATTTTAVPLVLNPHLPFTPIETLTSICVLTGLIQLGFGFFQMGAISLILSDQLISGFSCGAAFHVIVSQLPTVFDIKAGGEGNGPLHLIYELIDICANLWRVNYVSLMISAVVLVVIVLYKEVLEPQINKKISFPIPIDLIIVVIATIASAMLSLHDNYSVQVMGDVPTGLPMPKLPRFDYLGSILSDSLILAVVSFAVALSLGKIFAKKHGYQVRANQEFLALGTANVFSSFFACFPATASLSRTSVMGKHAKSQLSSIFSCVVLLLVLLFFAPTLQQLPKCVVAVIIIVAQKSLIMQVRDCRESWHISHYEGLTWLITFLAVILLGIDLGLIGGAAFSVFSIVMRFYSPKLRRLGQLPYTDIFLDIRQHRAAKEFSGVKILQFSSPLFFLNRELFQENVYKKVLGGQKFRSGDETEFGKVTSIILDCSAMSFIDSAGVEAIVEVSNDLHQKHHIEVALAACPPPVLSMLTKTNFFDKSPYTAIFPSVQEATHKMEEESPKLKKKMMQIHFEEDC